MENLKMENCLKKIKKKKKTICKKKKKNKEFYD